MTQNSNSTHLATTKCPSCGHEWGVKVTKCTNIHGKPCISGIWVFVCHCGYKWTDDFDLDSIVLALPTDGNEPVTPSTSVGDEVDQILETDEPITPVAGDAAPADQPTN